MKTTYGLKVLKILVSFLLVFTLLSPVLNRAYADTTLYNVQSNIANNTDYTVIHKINDKDAGYGANNLHFYLNSYVYPAESNPLNNSGYNIYLTLIGDQYTDGVNHSDSVTKSTTYFLSSKAELAWGRTQYDLDIKNYPLPDGVTTLDKVEVRFKSSFYAFSNTKSSNRLVITAMPAPDTEKPTTPIVYRNNNATWTNQDVTATLGGSTDNVGIKGYWYRINSSSSSDWKIYNQPLIFNKEGEFKLDAWVYDTSNNYSANYRIAYINIDKTPPSVPNISGIDESYKNVDSVSVALTDGEDTLSGIDHTEYYFSGATTSDWQVGNTALITNEGVTTIHARTVDKAGNTSSESIRIIRIDRTAPSLSVTEQKVDNTTVRFTVTAMDVSSGIKSIVLPDGNIINNYTAVYEAKTNGKYLFSAIDHVGLSSSSTKILTDLDGEPPIITATYDKNNVQTVTIHISASDTDTGIKSITLPDATVIHADEATYQVIQNGSYEFQAEDNAGNMAKHTVLVSNIDRNKPVLTVDYKENPASSLTFNIITSDEDSDIAFITLPDGRIVETDKAEYTISKNGTYTISVTDKANNTTEKTIEIKMIDTIQPELKISYDHTYQQSVKVNIQAIDRESGIDYVILPDKKILNKDQAEYMIVKNGVYVFEAIDKAGNTSIQTITIENVDITAPTIQLSSNSSTWNSDIEQVKILYTDHESGLDLNSLYYKVTNSEQTPMSWDVAESSIQTVSIDKEGEWYIHSKAKDLAGNIKEIHSQKFQYQKKPEIPLLNVKAVASNQLKLEWENSINSTNGKGYTYIIRNIVTGKNFYFSHPMHSFIDDQLDGGTNYKYTIQSQNYVGISEPSEAISAYTLPDEPLSASITKSGTDYHSALISIDPVKSATSYQIVAKNMSTGVIDGQRTVTENVYQPIYGLLPYSPYDISIVAINDSGSSKPYHLSYLSLPDKVEGFDSIQMMENAISLSWNTVSQATYNWSSVTKNTYYSLERENTNIYLGETNSYKDQYLLSGTPYSYAITAGNSTGFGQYSYLNEVWTLPSIVARLEQIDAETDTVTLSWQQSHGSLGYQLDVEGEAPLDVKGNISQYKLTGLQAGNTYRVRITPYNKSGYGIAKEISMTTLPDQMNLASIEVKDVEETNATFVIHPIQGANIYRLNIDNKEYFISAGEFKVTGLKGATHYKYSVSAGNNSGYGQSQQSNLLTIPPMVNLNQISKVTDRSLELSWNPISNVSYYSVYDEQKMKLEDLNMTQYEALSLIPGATYMFYVNASNQTGTGLSTKFSYRTLPESLSDDKAVVKVEKVEKNHVSLSWDEVKGADGYRLFNNQNQLLYEGTDEEVIIKELDSATLYSGWFVIPYNTSGVTRPLVVPDFVTLPSGKFVVSDGGTTRTKTTINIDHELSNETIVILLENKEVYRGQETSFTKIGLKPDTLYLFTVYSENSIGNKSVSTSIALKTKKEHEPINKDDTVSKDSGDNNIDSSTNRNTPFDTNQSTKDEELNFQDIEDSFNKNEIVSLYEMGLIKGTALTKYEPDRDITRAEFMAMIVRAKNKLSHITLHTSPSTINLTFEDINEKAWYMPELIEAMKSVYVKGYSTVKFAPEEVVNREQASKMIVNAAVGDITKEINTKLFPFTDSIYISKWATGSIQQGWDKGLILGYPDHSFKPKKNLTRAEAATLIYRIVVK